VEVQGYVYDAKVRMAALYEYIGRGEEAATLRHQAERLRSQVIDQFWIEELGTFALALDGEKRPVPTVASNAGHLLWSRLPDADRARRVAARLFRPDMFDGWGIRTLGADQPVFNPMSYHNGSVWPHDNALIVMGCAHYGLSANALPAVAAIDQVARAAAFHRLPELFCGIGRDGSHQPVWYPVSCSPQAWASGALYLMLQGVLGIFADAPANLLHIRNPVLPECLQELTVSGLAVGAARVSVHFRRHGTRTLVNVLSVESDDHPFQVRVEVG
jgi:glycogen debranching enzyme